MSKDVQLETTGLKGTLKNQAAAYGRRELINLFEDQNTVKSSWFIITIKVMNIFISGWCGQQQSSQLSTNLGGNLFSSGGLSGGSLNTLPTPQPVDNQNFQLQKPPPGNKRGKR
jgi:hypothetical protein